jgi:hypothetical protein
VSRGWENSEVRAPTHPSDGHVFPDHLEVTIGGALPLNVRYSEVGLKESEIGVSEGDSKLWSTPGRSG